MGLFKPNIQKMQKKRDVPGLIRALNDKDFFIRDAAAKALAQIGDTQALKPLVDALKDKNRNMRWSAATSLGKLGVGGMEQLIFCLKDDDPEVREVSAKSLGLIGEAKAIESLAQLLNDKQTNVARAAAESLEKMGDKRGKQAMLTFREEVEMSSSKTSAQTRPEVPLPPNNLAEVDINKLCEDGLRAAQNGDLQKSIQAWQSVIASQPDDVETHFLLAAAFQVLQDIDNSSKHYRQVLKLEPCNIEAHLDFSKSITSFAVREMSKTGQQFTMEDALQYYDYHEEALRSFATCQKLGKKFKGKVISNHLSHYQRFLGAALSWAEPIKGIKDRALYRTPAEWLRKMDFPSKSYKKVTLSGCLEDIHKSMKSDSVAFILAHPRTLKNFSDFLKQNKQKQTMVEPSMNNSKVKKIISHLSSGTFLLADIERVSLASDFSWIVNPSWNQLVLVLLNPDLMLLPELLGAIARTAIFNVKGAQRICFFAKLMEYDLMTGELLPIQEFKDYD